MKSELALAGSLSAIALAASAQAGAVGGIDMHVYAATGPNHITSASTPAWRANAMVALRNGLDSYGGSLSETPSAYERAGDVVDIGDMILSQGFNAWRGVASPSGAFASETGNSMHWGLSAVGTGGFQFSYSQLTVTVHGEGTPWASQQDMFYDYSTYSYDNNHLGVLLGADGVLNTEDDVLINSGASTQLVDAFYTRGPGWGWTANNPDQLAWLLGRGGYTQTGVFTFATAAGNFSGSDSISVVPAPGALALLGLAGVARRRRR